MDIKKIQEKINSNDFNFNINDFLSLIDSQNVNENLLFLEKVFLFCKSKIDNEIKKINKIDTDGFNFSKYQECVEVVNHILKLVPNLNIKKVLPNLKTPIKQRISFLRKKLRQWEYEYYGLEKPTVSDTTYDLTLKELNALEKAYPEFYSKSSPTNTVGGAIDNKFKKINHIFPMLSLSNAFNFEDLKHFDETIKKLLKDIKPLEIEYNIEPKLDGLSISLIYQKGKLVYGITRGDGKTGEDVTTNIRMIKSIPQTINNDFDRFEIRGEVFISNEQFKKINDSIPEEKNKFANPRNAASGTLRRLDPELVRERNLQMIAYYIPNFDDLEKLGIKKQSEVIDKLKEYGFTTAKEIYQCESIEKAYEKIQYLEKNQDNLDYPIDGAVIKENLIRFYDQLGTTSKFPHWAIAYKFIPKEAETQILSILTNVGRTGKITYVANLKPVSISGSIVSAATLNNAEYINSKDIRIGDTVKVFKAAEIIPYVKEVVIEKRNADSKPFSATEYCPICHTKLEKREGEVDQYCVNTSCPARVVQSIIHFCSKNAMNIEGLSEKTIAKYFELGYIKTIEDIYNLNNHRHEIITTILNNKFKTFNKINESIQTSKNNSLERLIFGLGIRDVGLISATFLARHFKNIDVLAKATKEELVALKDIGEVVSASIYDWFHNEANLKLLDNLKQLGINTTYVNKVHITSEAMNSEYFQKSFCITGTFDISRDKIRELLIKKYDAKVTNSVNKTTDYLIVGENGGSKIDKANELGIKLIYDKIW